MAIDQSEQSPVTRAHAAVPEPLASAESGEGLILGEASDFPPLLSVVLPTLNEEEAIGRCIEWIKDAVATLGVTAEIIVSDSSTDRTPDIARSMDAIVVEPEELGYGAAYRHAFEHARGQYIVMGDADCTYDFEQIPRLLDALLESDADIVLGSRREGEIEPGSMPRLHRYVGNPLLTGFLNAFYNADVTDAHSGFRVFRRDVLDSLDLRSNGMEFASEMIMEAAARGLHIEEVPITYHERIGDETLDSFRDGWRHIKFMLVNAPGYLFSIPGILIILIGAFSMALSLLGAVVAGATFGTHTMIAGSLLTVVGFQVASLGVFATVAGNPIRKPKDPITSWLVEHATLETGATIGVILFAAGGCYATVLLIQWINSGYTHLPLVVEHILAFTGIVLGVQTVFGSFFMSAVAGID